MRSSSFPTFSFVSTEKYNAEITSLSFFQGLQEFEVQEEGGGHNFHPQNPTSFDFQCFISNGFCEEFQLLFAQHLSPLFLLGLAVKQQHLRGSKFHKK